MSHHNEQNIPKHIAIVMDGNRRWAQANGKSVASGHKSGAENAKRIAKAAQELGVKYLTIYAFSSENWNRSQTEVDHLFFLLNQYIKNDKGEINKNDMRLKVIGDVNRLPNNLKKNIEELEKSSANNNGLVLSIAISYGARDELTQATKKIAEKVMKKHISPDDINNDLIQKHLFTCDIPDPDLFIRPSGEFRVSNFLLWQIAYTELYFTNILWPDFSQENLKEAIKEFSRRKRRYGK